MLEKKFLADHKTCKVTFTTDPAVTNNANEIALVGDFNDWDAAANPMKRRKDGSFAATVKLACGASYQFRYQMDRSCWENDAAADAYVPTPFGNSDNSIVDLQPPSTG